MSKKTRERTNEVIIASDSEDARTGYRLTVFFKRSSILVCDKIVIEAPTILGKEQVTFKVYHEEGLKLSTGGYNALSIQQFMIALGLIQKHQIEIIKVLTT